MKTVKDNITELREHKTPCAQATLLGISRGIKYKWPAEDLLTAITQGLNGGIGGTFGEGTCGAVTASAIALGLLFKHDPAKTPILVREMFHDFLERFGTVQCGKILKDHDFSICTQCCIHAGNCVERIYKRESGKQ